MSKDEIKFIPVENMTEKEFKAHMEKLNQDVNNLMGVTPRILNTIPNTSPLRDEDKEFFKPLIEELTRLGKERKEETMHLFDDMIHQVPRDFTPQSFMGEIIKDLKGFQKGKIYEPLVKFPSMGVSEEEFKNAVGKGLLPEYGQDASGGIYGTIQYTGHELDTMLKRIQPDPNSGLSKMSEEVMKEVEGEKEKNDNYYIKRQREI